MQVFIGRYLYRSLTTFLIVIGLAGPNLLAVWFRGCAFCFVKIYLLGSANHTQLRGVTASNKEEAHM